MILIESRALKLLMHWWENYNSFKRGDPPPRVVVIYLKISIVQPQRQSE